MLFSANPKNSPSIAAFFHAELPVKMVALDVLDRGYASALGLAEVEDVQAVANLHRGEWILKAFGSDLSKRCSVEHEHDLSVLWSPSGNRPVVTKLEAGTAVKARSSAGPLLSRTQVVGGWGRFRNSLRWSPVMDSLWHHY